MKSGGAAGTKGAERRERARSRPYRMGARAEAAAATGERILDAAVELFWAEPSAAVPLERVAAQAGVSAQTVIRRFGGREGLLAAAAEREQGRIAAQRDAAPEDDPRAALRILVGHYEEIGERVLRLLAEEERDPALAAVAERGRTYHRAWCERVFAAGLAGLDRAERRRRLAQLVAVCDVQTWRLLRRDAGLGRRQTELALAELVEPLLERG